MKRFCAAGCLLFLIAAGATAQELPQMPKPQKEHQWLQQFVGEWDSEMEAMMGPGQPSVKCKGTMSSRSLGGFWIVSDMKSEFMGNPTSAVLTIGYDPTSKKYVGTWVDSMTGYLWKYEGAVDAAGKVLTLEAQGPNMTQPGKLAKFRDVYEFKSSDHVVLSSSVQGEDGKWITFMTGNVRRRMKLGE